MKLLAWIAACVICLLPALPAWPQYPGQLAKSAGDSPELRAIAVLEWTGDADKPKASRMVPITVLDGGELQDGSIYLARPEPLALTPEVEYILQQDGKPVGLFDIQRAGQEEGSWVGFGAWKSMPVPRPAASARQMARDRFDDDAQSDQPVLHRKHHADDAPAAGTSGSGSGSGSGAGSDGQSQPTDPDRPTLHRRTSSGNPDDAGSGTNPGDAGDAGTTNSGSSSAPDPDQPTLHRRSSSGDSGSASAPADDPDRPVLKKKKQTQDEAYVEPMASVVDPNRPRLLRGKPEDEGPSLLPSLMGLPPDMHQEVAVSDAKNSPVHLWSYSWANPGDEAKMKSALEEIARGALGLNPPPPAPKPASKKTASRKKAKPAPPPPPPAPLVDEQFRVFELAYGSGATMVLSARTAGPAAQQKFVTLVAQPDLYGSLLVLLKNVTDGAHLDETPRMRLIDAVDAMADNRGELLFELRGATQRQFALYRVLRGQIQKLFVTGGGQFGSASND